MTKLFIFTIVALLILVSFRHQLRSVKEYGFYMFFAFESLLVLMFFNIGFWFAKSFSWYQFLSWVLLVVSALIALGGFYGLKKYGRAEGGWENTTQLITRGIFRYIRHPLYSSLILLATGILLKNLRFHSIVAWSFSVAFLITGSLVEEKENLLKFGAPYSDYKCTTKRYLPYIL